MEDGEISSGFLGEEEMESRKALATAHGEGAGMSWVEAVLLGTGIVSAVDTASAGVNVDTKKASTEEAVATPPVRRKL